MDTKLTDITDLDQLAALLGFKDIRQLNYYIYVIPEEERYQNFETPKRSGGKREISAPKVFLKTIQTILAIELEKKYIHYRIQHMVL
jgi:hypothetical protein